MNKLHFAVYERKEVQIYDTIQGNNQANDKSKFEDDRTIAYNAKIQQVLDKKAFFSIQS